MTAAFYLGRIVWVRHGYDEWRAGTVVDLRHQCVSVQTLDGSTVHVHQSVFARDLRVTRPRGTR